MKLSKKHITILDDLLLIEHIAIAQKLKLIPIELNIIDSKLLNQSIGMIDELSRYKGEISRKAVVVASSILWSYKEDNWDGLKDFLIICLSRSGFSPSALMIDKDFNRETGTFSANNSIINQLAITLYQLSHEIFIDDKKFLITDFQKKVWNKLNENKFLGISAPTSAGKSFIILLKSIDLIIKNGGNIIYIVPTLSLVAQVSADFNEKLKLFGLTQYNIATTFNSGNSDESKIYVLTQEKAISAFSQIDQPFKNIRILIVDEIQNIERAPHEGDQRAKTLYDSLIEFRYSCKPDLTIFSGPRVDGLKELGIDVFNEQNSDEEKTKDSPVASFTYAIFKEGKKYYVNQYCDLVEKPNKLPIEYSDHIKGYGKAQYSDDFVQYLSYFTDTLGDDSINIIFSPTAKQARNTAIKLAELKNAIIIDDKINSLISYIQETVHDKYDMTDTMTKGIVYHHGKTPSHIRAVVENAIKNKMITNVVCTTTLMQGVNLPAQNVIMRNPYLSIQSRNGVKPKLTDYEVANLRGRAGRLLKDFIGRTYILEENSFEVTAEQPKLFPEAEKTLRSGYGDKYDQYKKEITSGLISNSIQDDQNLEYAFLMVYIRQIILKHKENSRGRLLAVGIDISEVELNDIFQLMKKELVVPHEICYKNRYWDPLDLNLLYIRRNDFILPMSVNEENIDTKLENLITSFKALLPHYSEKYFKIHENFLHSVFISANSWMKEKPLKEILNTAYFDTSDKIDDRISLIQKEISYGLPMLLKPIYDIVAPNNMFLRFIEIGAYMPITRKMIELNIPRETAIYLSNKFFNDFPYEDGNIEESILYRLKEIYPQVDYWRQIQIENVI